MSTAEKALIQLEQGATLVDFELMTDSGDHQRFTNPADVYSGKAGSAPEVRPNGIVTGRNLVSVPASGANDAVDVLAFTAYSLGVLQTIAAAADKALTRPATNVARVNSITMTNAGAIAVIAGTSATDTTFVETRGAAGGPPFIPVDSIELAQVRLTSSTAAPVTASEIYQVIGQHAERYDFPVFTVNNVGYGNAADTPAETNAHVKMTSALPLSHTGNTPKRVYLKYYEPTFGDLAKGTEFQPAETSHSVSSSQYYGGTIGSKSSTLGQAQFNALLDDGVMDGLVADKDEVLTVKFFPDRNKAPFIITQGTIGIARSFPVADQISASITVSAETSSAEFSG